MIPGIDVSHHQGGIHWPLVAKTGKKFAFLKASEGAGMTDDHFPIYRSAATAQGILVGAYHFYKFDANWGAQAHHFSLTVMEHRKGELPPVLDIEDREGIAKLSKIDAHRKLLAWLNAIEQRLQVTPMVYCDSDFANVYLQDKGFAAYPLWLAGYSQHLPYVPSPWKHITFWQNSDHGTVPGVYGDCDLDYYLGNEADLKKLAGLA